MGQAALRVLTLRRPRIYTYKCGLETFSSGQMTPDEIVSYVSYYILIVTIK